MAQKRPKKSVYSWKTPAAADENGQVSGLLASGYSYWAHPQLSREEILLYYLELIISNYGAPRGCIRRRRQREQNPMLSQLKAVALGGSGQGKATAALDQFKASNGAARGLVGRAWRAEICFPDIPDCIGSYSYLKETRWKAVKRKLKPRETWDLAATQCLPTHAEPPRVRGQLTGLGYLSTPSSQVTDDGRDVQTQGWLLDSQAERNTTEFRVSQMWKSQCQVYYPGQEKKKVYHPKRIVTRGKCDPV